jgi:hypothetical protein
MIRSCRLSDIAAQGVVARHAIRRPSQLASASPE